jgi:chromosome segregation ATPase
MPQGTNGRTAREAQSRYGTHLMLTARKLEQFLEVEDKLRGEFQQKLDTSAAELARCQKELATQREQMQATIDTQLATIADLSSRATVSQRTEQLNRELTNRSEKLAEEAATLKKRARDLQKELSEARELIKGLTQYDPERMKKNLDAGKKKLAEQTSANDALQKALAKTRAENTELQRKMKALEEKLAATETAEEAEEEVA